jgi:deoxyribonuclease IV
LKVGVHVSISGSIDQAVDRAQEYGCDTFQMFTRNPQGWKFGDLDPDQVKKFREKLGQSKIGPIIDHMPYLPNLSCPEDEIYEKSVASFAAEVDRCHVLGISYLVTHLGSHLGKGREIGLERITSALSLGAKRARGELRILLENMAGTKNSMGSNFQDIKEILDGVKKRDRLGVCLDTCHLYAAGFDVQSERGVQQTLAKFNEVVGFDTLKVVHLNDSKGGLASGLDRHENIGKGYIGEKGFRAILHHPAVKELPLILETPVDQPDAVQSDLQMVRKLAK